MDLFNIYFKDVSYISLVLEAGVTMLATFKNHSDSLLKKKS